MRIYQALQADHLQILTKVAAIVAAPLTNTKSENLALIEALAEILVPHERAEEKTFYATLEQKAPHSTGHSFGDHLAGDAMFAAVRTLNEQGLNFRPTAAALQGALVAHIRNEEDQVFTLAKSLLSDKEANSVGQAFLEDKKSEPVP